MAEALTIARPYAEAAFKIAQEQNALPDWADALNRLAIVASTPEARRIADDPGLKSSVVADVIADSAGPLSAEQKNFLHALVDNDRLGVLSEVATHYRKLHANQVGTLDAEVRSAFPLSDDQTAQIKSALEEKYQKPVNVEIHVAPELIGGVSIRIGDDVMDSSVRGKLDQMANSLKI
ncbi:MAG: F0F1 ATP synthase subunit delta [Burkholderiaceae bacterium]